MNIGFCGLDRDRRPLSGDEIRPCWEHALPAVIRIDEDAVVTPAYVPAAGRPDLNLLADRD